MPILSFSDQKFIELFVVIAEIILCKSLIIRIWFHSFIQRPDWNDFHSGDLQERRLRDSTLIDISIDAYKISLSSFVSIFTKLMKLTILLSFKQTSLSLEGQMNKFTLILSSCSLTRKLLPNDEGHSKLTRENLLKY